jgi:hypothetical protein
MDVFCEAETEFLNIISMSVSFKGFYTGEIVAADG